MFDDEVIIVNPNFFKSNEVAAATGMAVMEAGSEDDLKGLKGLVVVEIVGE
jgi:hypothetical protein